MNAALKSSLQRSKRRETLGTFLWVSFVTIIIWVWADLEQTRSEIVSVPIVVMADPAGEMLVQSPGPKGVLVHFTCRGAQGRLENFTRELSERAATGDPVRCTVRFDPAWQPGEHYLNTAEILSGWETLRDAGLSAEEPTPSSIQVSVDRWVNATATVMLRTTDNAALVDKTIEPAQVPIRVAEKDYRFIKDRLVVSTESIDLSGLPVGQEVTVTANLAAGIEGRPIEFLGGSQVSVKLRLGRRTVTRTLKLPVQLLCPPELMEQVAVEGYVFSRKDRSADGEWMLEITVNGERKDIEKLLSDPAAAGAEAFVVVTPSDFEKTDIHPDRPVRVLLPPGVELIGPENPKVHFKFNATDEPHAAATAAAGQ